MILCCKECINASLDSAARMSLVPNWCTWTSADLSGVSPAGTRVEYDLKYLFLLIMCNNSVMGPHPRSTHDLHTAFPEAKEKLLSSNSLVKILYITCMSEWQYCTNGCTFVIFVKKKETKKMTKENKSEFTYVNLLLSSVNCTSVIPDKWMFLLSE